MGCFTFLTFSSIYWSAWLERTNKWLGARLVILLEQHFSHFKQTYTHFHTLFYPHVYQNHSNNITQTPLPNTPLISTVHRIVNFKSIKSLVLFSTPAVVKCLQVMLLSLCAGLVMMDGIFTFVSSCPWLIFEFWTIDVCYEFSLYTLFLRDNEMGVF